MEDLADSGEWRAAISGALRMMPLNEQALRFAVWSFVSEERRKRVSAAAVITKLSDLIDEAAVAPARQPGLTRSVILWCVEEYFGHVDGNPMAR